MSKQYLLGLLVCCGLVCCKTVPGQEEAAHAPTEMRLPDYYIEAITNADWEGTDRLVSRALPKDLFKAAHEEILQGDFAPEPYQIKAEDDAETRLMKQRINNLYVMLDVANVRANKGMSLPSDRYVIVSKLCDARFDFHKDLPTRRIILVDKVVATRILEQYSMKRFDHFETKLGFFNASEMRINAELELLRFNKAHPQVK